MNTARPFRPGADFKALLRLRQAVEVCDLDGADVSEKALRTQLAWPGHNPAHDRWVMDDPNLPDSLAAHALVWCMPNSSKALIHIIVAPPYRRRGLGTILWALAVQRARQLGATETASYVNGLNAAADAFARSCGCLLDWPYVEYRRTTCQPLAGCLPEGWTVRSYSEVQDLPLLTHAMNEAYDGLAGHHPVDENQMAAWLPDFCEKGLLLLFTPGDELAGISRSEINADRSTSNGCTTGYVDAPGILPTFRSMQLYRGLLQAAIQWLHGQGCAWVELEGWGEPPERLQLFEEEGFSLIKSIHAYSLPLV